MRIICVTPVYNEENLIKGCIDNMRPYVDKHMFLVSQRPYYRDYDAPDRSAEIANENGCFVINGKWDQEHKQRNTGNIMSRDFDWVLWMDADMRYTEENINRLIDYLKNTDVDVVLGRHKSYWKEVGNLVEDDFTPVLACRPHVRFIHIAVVGRDVSKEICPDLFVHHLAWCAPKDIKKKVMTYGHSNEFDGEYWYNNHFLNSDDDEAVFPDGKILKITKEDFPQELVQFI